MKSSNAKADIRFPPKIMFVVFCTLRQLFCSYVDYIGQLSEYSQSQFTFKNILIFQGRAKLISYGFTGLKLTAL